MLLNSALSQKYVKVFLIKISTPSLPTDYNINKNQLCLDIRGSGFLKVSYQNNFALFTSNKCSKRKFKTKTMNKAHYPGY